MSGRFRSLMTVLHCWIGFLAGGIVFAIFLTGTITVFDTELQSWMQPETVLSAQSRLTPDGLRRGEALFRETLQAGQPGFLLFPSVRDPSLRLLHYDGHEFIGPVIDPQSGRVIAARATAGGQFFYNLHTSLRLKGLWGLGLVAFGGVMVILAVLTGLAIQFRRLILDLLLFRPRASSRRAWLDAHLLTGVVCLPFILMISVTGVWLQLDKVAHALHRPSGAPHPAPVARHLPGGPDSLNRMLTQAQSIFGPEGCGFLIAAGEKMSLYRRDGERFLLTRDHADFAPRDGRLLALSRPTAQPAWRPFLLGLHDLRWGDYGMRWLYFLCGAAGTLSVASGMILFLMKYRRDHAARFGFRLAEVLVCALIFGLPTASLGLLWADRLIPSTLSGRLGWEAACFFTLWGLSLGHAAFFFLRGKRRQAYRHQGVLLALAGLFLPALDLLTRPFPLPREALFAGVDLTGMATGLAAAYAQNRLGKS